MSNIEHLFENAICAHLRGETYEDFCKYPGNQMMIADEETDPEVIWLLAQYTASTYEVPRWIPVAERLPERSGDYLCVCDDGEEPYVVIIQYNDEQEAFGHEVAVYDPDSLGFVETEFEKWSVTHWHLLPELPEEKEE